MKKTLLLLALFAGSLFNVARADDAAIKNSFKKMDMEVEEIKDSPLPGIKWVLTGDGVFYATEDGKYVMVSIYDLSGEHPANIMHNELLDRIDNFADEMIVFKANKEKYVITVFTDPTCGYCIKLQNEIADYNKRGITVRYLAYPRQGLNSQEANELQSVWCATNPKAAFTEATKNTQRKAITASSCDIDISRHYRLGVQLGISGTPAIIYKDVTIPGYVAPEQLVKMLDSYEAKGK